MVLTHYARPQGRAVRHKNSTSFRQHTSANSGKTLLTWQATTACALHVLTSFTAYI